jgi:predicted phosphodiesterase
LETIRVAVISDIHGSCLALDAVLDDLAGERVDQFVCLGDAIQGGPQPAETVARLRELGLPVVLGNADDYLLNGATDDEPESEYQAVMRTWSLKQLSEADRACIRIFQPAVTVSLGAAGELLAFHGSPHSFNDIVFPETPDDDVLRLFGLTDAVLLAGGHTHVQQIRRLDRARFINPGSIGQAYDPRQAREIPHCDPWAEYAVVTTGDDGRINIDFRRVPYDVSRLLAIGMAAGIPMYDTWAARYSE